MRLFSTPPKRANASLVPLRLAVAATGLIFVVDALRQNFSPPLAVLAAMDESAHIATATVWLLVLSRYVRMFFVFGAVAGAVLIDIDHVPMVMGWSALIPVTYRPYTHSLITVIATLLLATLMRGPSRVALVGVAFGLMTHLVRDMATGGVPLLWPLTIEMVHLSYPVYAVTILGALGVVYLRRQPAKNL